MRAPICLECCREMRCMQNEHVVEIVSDGRPYELWSGDRWVCETCPNAVVTGFGMIPIAERADVHYSGTRDNAINRGGYTRVDR